MPLKLTNNASGTLATAISASDTGVVLTTGDGAEFPILGTGDYFYATITSSQGTQEIVKVTARVGDTMTVVRAQESTTATGFAVGARLELRVTAQTVLDAGQYTERVSLKGFGAVGDGVTNDTAAIAAAAAQSPYFASPGTYVSTTANTTLLSGRQYGFGQIKTADNNKSAPNFSNISAPPAAFGNENSILTAFNGDISKCQFAVAHNISGVDTLGQPTTGYLYRPEAMPHYTYMYNTSGWNQSTSSNVGRTGVAAYRTRVFQAGQGDAVCYNGSVFVTGNRAGATNFLANPAGVLFNGDMTAGADGVYMNPYETICVDGGYDTACVGVVNNFSRTNDTGANNVVWMGYRAQSTGSKPVDAFVSATGSFRNGLDLTTANFGTNEAAISLKALQRIYFNNTATPPSGGTIAFVTNNYNGEWMRYNGSVGEIQFAGLDAVQFSIGRTASAVNYFGVLGATSGALPQFRTYGSDTNISAGYVTKGTGFHFFYSNIGNSVQFAIAGSISNSVNYATVRGAATGSSPRIFSTGSDTNLDLQLYAKGSGVIDLGTTTSASAGSSAGYINLKINGSLYKVQIYNV